MKRVWATTARTRRHRLQLPIGLVLKLSERRFGIRVSPPYGILL